MVSAISLVGLLRQFLLFANTSSPHTIRSCARRKVRSSFCPFDKMFVRQSVSQQNVRSAKCLSAKCPSAKCPGTVLVFLAHRHYVSSTLFSAGKPFQYMLSIVWKRRSVFISRSSYLVTGSFAIIAHRFLHLVQDVGFFFCIDLRNYVLSPTTFDFPKTFDMLIYLTTRRNSINFYRVSGAQSSNSVCPMTRIMLLFCQCNTTPS